MNCVECGRSVQTRVLVTFTTGRMEELPLCPDCQSEYEEGAFVSSVSDETPSHGGQPQKVGRCTECGEIYPAQVTSNNQLRPVGRKDGTCLCGNAEFKLIGEG